MPLSLDDAQRLLAGDISATLGATHVPLAEDFAESVRELDLDAEYQPTKLVDDVQQFIQDLFIDTTWPACPRHPNHALDYSDGMWRCPRDGAGIARLGELAGLRAGRTEGSDGSGGLPPK